VRLNIPNSKLLDAYWLTEKDVPIPKGKVRELSTINSPLLYANTTEEYNVPFQSCMMNQAKIQLIPNKENRKSKGIKEIRGISGVTHFFLDHDLSNGFVHPYTSNFYNKQNQEYYVLKFTPSSKNKLIGSIQYIKKKELKPNDKLGVNIAFFRQWKLSSIDYQESNGKYLIHVEKSSFNPMYDCPQAKKSADPGCQSQIPLLLPSSSKKLVDVSTFNQLNNHLGGTVVIIWEDKKTHKTYFIDVHQSFYYIFQLAINIAKKYHVDPTIAIGDAGPFTPKVKSNASFVLNTKYVDDMTYNGGKFGAGFGYEPIQASLFELINEDGNKAYYLIDHQTKTYERWKKCEKSN
jgi:hypothetical protein